MTFLILVDCEEEFSEILAGEISENFECEGVISSYQKFENLEIVHDDKRLKIFVKNYSGITEFAERFRELLITRGFTPKEWQIKIEEIPDKDWSSEWKKHWKPSKISRKIVIKPSWENYSRASDEIVVELDPSNAFGTGEHATTRLCVQFLEENAKCNDSVADIGCGSGILAICAAKLKACAKERIKLNSFNASHGDNANGQIIGVDNDETVIETANKNAQRNNVDIKFKFGTSSDLKQEFDIVVANILHSVIADIMPDLTRITKKGGLLIFSGILDEKKHIVFDKIIENNLKVLEERHMDKWVAILARREH